MRRYLVPGLVLVVLLTGCTGGGQGTEPQGASGSSSSSASSAPALRGPVGLAQAPDGTVWAAWAGSDSISPIVGDGTPGAPVAVGRTPLRLLEHDGSLWVTTIRDGGLHQVNPASGAVVRTVQLGGEPEGLTAYDGHLFVVLQADAALVEVDPADGSVVRRYDVGGAPRLVVAGERALYVSDYGGGRVVRVAPGPSPKVTRSEPLCAGVQDLEVLADRVWAACMTDGAVAAFDPDSLAVRTTVRVEGDPDGLAAGPGADLLVSLQDGPGLAVVDTRTGAVERAFSGTSGRLLDQANNDVLERDGTAFLSDFTGNTVEVVRL